MEREKAITILKNFIPSETVGESNGVKEIREAFKMAIDALNELPKRRKEVKRWKGKWLHEKK